MDSYILINTQINQLIDHEDDLLLTLLPSLLNLVQAVLVEGLLRPVRLSRHSRHDGGLGGH